MEEIKTLKDEYYEHVLDKKDFGKVKNAVFQLVSDLKDRRGLSQEWDQIDDDIQDEIIETWINIVRVNMGQRESKNTNQMTKDEAIEIIENACKGKAIKEDFFKSPKEIVGDTLDAYAKSKESDSLPCVSGISTDFEKDLFKLINSYAKEGLSKGHTVGRLEWVLGSVKKS